jgi:hypothetical protein
VACVRSRDIYGHACHAQSRGGSSAIGNCQSRVPQYSQSTVESPDTNQSRLSGRGLESTTGSSVPATGRLRRQSTQSRLIKSRYHGLATGGIEESCENSPAAGSVGPPTALATVVTCKMYTTESPSRVSRRTPPTPPLTVACGGTVHKLVDSRALQGTGAYKPVQSPKAASNERPPWGSKAVAGGAHPPRC